MFCRLYRLACKRYRRSGLTFSASAHLLAMQGRPGWRDFIDAVARVFGDDQHCATSFERESSTKSSKETVMGEKVGAVVGYGGSGTAFVFGLTTSQWQVIGVAGGLLIGFLGFAVNVWFAWRRDQREERARGTM